MHLFADNMDSSIINGMVAISAHNLGRLWNENESIHVRVRLTVLKFYDEKSTRK